MDKLSDDKVFCPFCMANVDEATQTLDDEKKEVVVWGHCNNCKGKFEMDRIKDEHLYNKLKDPPSVSAFKSIPKNPLGKSLRIERW